MPAATVHGAHKSLIRVVTELNASAAAPADPAAIIRRVNASSCQSNDDMMFVTLFFGILSPSGVLLYCNAGHNPRIGSQTARFSRSTAKPASCSGRAERGLPDAAR